MAFFKQHNTANPQSHETKRADTPCHRMLQEWRCCQNLRGLVQDISKKEEWKLACVNVFTRVNNKTVHFWPVFHLLTNTKPSTAQDQNSPLGIWGAWICLLTCQLQPFLGKTAASTSHLPLYYFLHFFTASPPHALWCNSWGVLLPRLLKSLPAHGHLYPSLSPSRGDRGGFTIIPLPCLCLLRTLQPCLWLDAYWPVHASKTAASKAACASPFSIRYCHVGYTVPSTTVEWDVSQWQTKTDWNLLLSEWQMLSSMCLHTAL